MNIVFEFIVENGLFTLYLWKFLEENKYKLGETPAKKLD